MVSSIIHSYSHFNILILISVSIPGLIIIKYYEYGNDYGYGHSYYGYDDYYYYYYYYYRSCCE